jgi:hypothetical protein
MYKKRPADTHWTRLTETFAAGFGERMSGCAGLGVHPTDDNLLYAALLKGIYKSTDQGRTWDRVLDVRVWPNGKKDNGNDRNYGEALVVDQRNGNVVYYGSQDDGLFYTHNGGESWTQIPDSQLPHKGSRSVVVDNLRAKLSDGRAKYVYVSVKGQGIYRSNDGGLTFSQWQATLPGGGTYVRWLRQSQQGDLYAAHEKGLAHWNGESWKDVSPVVGKEVTAVAVDPKNNYQVICFTNKNIYRSRNQGKQWEIAPYIAGDLPQWAQGRYQPGQSTTFALYFDDQSEGPNSKAYVCSNYYPWQTDDIWASKVIWDAMHQGNEMTINITGVSLPTGSPYIAGVADVRGFKYDEVTENSGRLHINPADVKANLYTPNFTGIDFSENDPNELWFVGSQKVENKEKNKTDYVSLVFRSDDGGENLRYVSNPASGTNWEKEDAGGAKLAVSATNADKAVIMVKNHVRYTHDGGKTWKDAGTVNGIDGLLERTIEYEFDQLIKSDRINGDKFYLYATTGKFYKSTNAGANFSEVSTAGLPHRIWEQGGRGVNSSTGGGVHMAVAPGMEEEVWLALGASGIWKASGSGTNKTSAFTEITFFDRMNPTAVTFGKAAPSSSTPTAYVFGKRKSDGQWGVWKSDDLGDNWELISPQDEPGQWCRLLVGDNQTYGRVYMGDASYGIRVLTATFAEKPEAIETAPEIAGDSAISGSIVVDNPKATVYGKWAPRTHTPGNQTFSGQEYLVNASDDAGTVRFVPDILQAGYYEVYGRWISTNTRATNVPYIIAGSGDAETVVVNQQQDGGDWVLLGAYHFAQGAEGYVEIQNEGTDGIVVADATRWKFAAPSPNPDKWYYLESQACLNSNNSMRLDVDNCSSLNLKDSTNSTGRQWQFASTPDGKSYFLINRACGYRLDVEKCNTMKVNASENDQYKRWKLRLADDKTFYMENVGCSNRRLKSEHCSAVALGRGTGDQYRWKLVEVGDPNNQEHVTTKSTQSKAKAEDQVIVYGNPVRDVLKISVPDIEQLQNLRLINASNEKVATDMVVDGNTVSLSVGHLNRGIYLLRGRLDQQPFTKRVLLQ